MAEVFVVTGLGGKRILKGEIPVRGAKNAALKMLAASLLFTGDILYERVPDIEDTTRILELLSKLGVTSLRAKSARGKAKKEKSGDSSEGRITLSVPTRLSAGLDTEIAKRFRASIVLTGPLLARRGVVTFPHPGGCLIGERPIDVFLEGFEQMGATVKFTQQMYKITAPQGGLRGARIFMRKQSVTATETFLMTAVLAKGTTILENSAMEPEIVSLAGWLNACGADITGAGTPTITIVGGKTLVARASGVVMPDRIEAGSFLILGALLAKKLIITQCYSPHLMSLIETLRFAGAHITISKLQDEITVVAPTVPRAVSVKTHEYPGFPTDLQAPMTVFLTQAKGESMVFETIFEGRLGYTESLVRMGAEIKTMDPHRVLVTGPTPLRGRLLESPDLRAGLAYIIAAAVAKGDSVIHEVYYIDRGYEEVEKRLQSIGLPIRRSTI